MNEAAAGVPPRIVVGAEIDYFQAAGNCANACAPVTGIWQAKLSQT